MEKIYEDIFEAIRAISPNHPILNLKDRSNKGMLQRNLTYEALTMPNHKTFIMPQTGINIMFYRGERKIYPHCYPSLYRSSDKFEMILNQLRTIDFMLLAKEFPPVYYAEKMGVDVDMLALAQHYELATDMLDLTSDLTVAAFFATTYRDDVSKRYVAMSSGEGRICSYCFIPDNNFFETGISAFRFVGLQPFERPGRQCAFGIQLEEGQSFEDVQNGFTIRFRHQKQQNQKILDIFGEGQYNTLFPKELIADVAGKVKTSNYVTSTAIQQYCTQYGTEEHQISQMLQDHEITISKMPLFRLTRRQNEQMRKEFRNNPFGGVKIYHRLMYIPSEPIS